MPIRTVRRRRVVLPQAPGRPKTVWPKWPGWSPALLALLPLGCVALGGTTERWSEGIMLLVLGGVLVAVPPRISLGRGLNLVVAALILLSLAAFLPARWFFLPAWRTALTDDFGVALPSTLSPQPFLTAESLVVFAAGLSWFYLMGTIRWHDETRRWAGVIFAGGTAALAVFAVACYRAGVIVPIWPSERHFGPFPNRNQTADFFALAALPILACARAAWRAGQKPAALAWLAGWLATALAVFHSFSRAGMFLLAATTAVYLGVETFHRTRHQWAGGGSARWRRVAMVVSLGLMAGSTLLLFGGETLSRLRSNGVAAEGNAMSDALRLNIYKDAAGMIVRLPWCGNGLDTFNEIFPAYRRQAIQSPLRVKHPESDWLWLGAELGWPSLLVALVGTVLVVRRLRPPKRGHDRPLRLAAALGVMGFLAHSLVDVSAHRVGSAFAALFLLGLALPGPPTKPDGDAPLPPHPLWLGWVFRATGIVFLLVGVLWLLEARGVLLLPGAQGVERLRREAHLQIQTRQTAAAYRSLAQALAWSPLDWRTYYLRGAIGVSDRRGLDETLADFRRARYLENIHPALPLGEARLWAAAGQTVPAVNALLEACRRDAAHGVNLIQPVYTLLRQDPDFLDRMRSAALRDPALTIAWLGALSPPDSADFITDVLRADPDLRKLGDVQKTQFFEMWSLRGDPPRLTAAMTAHPAWQILGWRGWAEAAARDGTPAAARDASQIVSRFAPKPVMPAGDAKSLPPEELRRNAGKGTLELEQALPLYRAQAASGDTIGALRTLRQVTSRPDCPAYFYYLEAQAATAAEQWPVSWTAWQKYLSARPDQGR